MIQRRQFLGSAATLFGAASLTKIASASDSSTNRAGLNWRCNVIQTVPQNKARRCPVVTGVSLQNNGNLLAIVGDDHYVSLYDTTQRQFVEHLDGHTDWVRTAKFSPDGTKLATAGNDRELLIWRADRWKAPVVTKRHPEAIIDCAYSNNGQKLATVGFEQTLRLYGTENGRLLQKFSCACPDNHAVAFSKDDAYLAAGGRCGTIRVWDMSNNRSVAQFKAHKKRIRSIEFTSDGKVVSAGDDQVVRVTDPLRPNTSKSFPRHAAKLYSTAILDGNLLAIGGSDNLIHVWNLNDFQEVGPLKGHTGTVSCLDYSTGKLVSGSYDTRVRLWHTEKHISTPIQRETKLIGGANRNGWNRRIK